MQLTFVNDMGQTFTVEIDPAMELQDVQALVEVEVSHSPHLMNLLHLMHGLGYSPVYPYPNKLSH